MRRQDYSYALNKDSSLIRIEEAQKDEMYFCPCCGDTMIPKRGTIRKWHYAHKGDTGKCSYETYLHKVAKKSIHDCFDKSEKFEIVMPFIISCSELSRCPLGVSKACEWSKEKIFNLKKYYNQCEEEVSIGKFRADLLFTNAQKGQELLIEIKVSHESTKEKIQSGYRIIELTIGSEDDIKNIVDNATIKDYNEGRDLWSEIVPSKIKFYNFRDHTTELPEKKDQVKKYRFWIDSKLYYHFEQEPISDFYHDSETCLSQVPPNIETSRFRIESKYPIDLEFAFMKLSESGLGIKYCPMCDYYRKKNNDRPICVLSRTVGTKLYPRQMDAMKCPHYKTKLTLSYSLEKECKITKS